MLERSARISSAFDVCVIHGPNRWCRRWEASAARKQLHHAATAAGVRRRFTPHQLRHAHAVEMAHEGVPLVVIQRQLGHANLAITSIYLQGIDSNEIIETVHGRPSPTISASAGLQIRRQRQPFGSAEHPPADPNTPAWRVACLPRIPRESPAFLAARARGRTGAAWPQHRPR